MGQRIDYAVIAVGLLLLERFPKGLMLAEESLADNYPAAEREFIEYMALEGRTFDPPTGFRQRVIDHVTRYLEHKGYIR